MTSAQVTNFQSHGILAARLPLTLTAVMLVKTLHSSLKMYLWMEISCFEHLAAHTILLLNSTESNSIKHPGESVNVFIEQSEWTKNFAIQVSKLTQASFLQAISGFRPVTFKTVIWIVPWQSLWVRFRYLYSYFEVCSATCIPLTPQGLFVMEDSTVQHGLGYWHPV